MARGAAGLRGKISYVKVRRSVGSGEPRPKATPVCEVRRTRACGVPKSRGRLRLPSDWTPLDGVRSLGSLLARSPSRLCWLTRMIHKDDGATSPVGGRTPRNKLRICDRP